VRGARIVPLRVFPTEVVFIPYGNPFTAAVGMRIYFRTVRFVFIPLPGLLLPRRRRRRPYVDNVTRVNNVAVVVIINNNRTDKTKIHRFVVSYDIYIYIYICVGVIIIIIIIRSRSSIAGGEKALEHAIMDYLVSPATVLITV